MADGRMTPKDFKVGQAVVAVMSRYRSPQAEPFEVVAIGRKWVTACRVFMIGGEKQFGMEMRFDPETGYIDGGQHSSPGRVWLTLEAWQVHTRMEELWRTFSQRVRHQNVVPTGMTIELVSRWLAEFDAAVQDRD